MPNVAINILGWDGTNAEILMSCIKHALAQDYDDYIVVYSDNCSKTLSGQMQERFGQDPKFKINQYSENFGYAGGHNRFFVSARAPFVMVMNPDALLEPTFLTEAIAGFDQELIGAVTGKMIKPKNSDRSIPDVILDGTGVVMDITRRGRERGQQEIDHLQYDLNTEVFGVSGTAAIYRRAALERIRLGEHEYFDEDFFAYWEDVDLSWRLQLAGYSCRYVPTARVIHTRLAGAHKGGYRDVLGYIAHHNELSISVRRWNWRNHLFMIIKNDFGWNFFIGLPFIMLRELAMLGYIICFEPKTLGILPSFFSLLPKIIQKRSIIQHNRIAKSSDMFRWFKKIQL